MASPSAAPRPCPTCKGPVGLADTNSTFTRRPRPSSDFPYASPAAMMVSRISVRTLAGSLTLMKPGPATSTENALPSSASNSVRISSAMSRGFLFSCLANWRATFVARSPCTGSRGRSIVISVSGAPRFETAVWSAARRLSAPAVKISLHPWVCLSWLVFRTSIRKFSPAIPSPSLEYPF